MPKPFIAALLDLFGTTGVGTTIQPNPFFHAVVLPSVLDACRQTLIYEYIILP